MKLILVEKGTIEGYTAAWVAKRMLKNECEIVMIRKGDKLPPTKDKDVLCFGVSFNRYVVSSFEKAALADHTEFHLFDNDQKGKQELSGLKSVKINLTQTAARMAWEYLRADFKVKVGKEKKSEFRFNTAPWIVDYTDNAKLWKWPTVTPYFLKLAIENCYKQELEDWDELATRDLDSVMEQGKEFAKKQLALEEPNEEEENKKRLYELKEALKEDEGKIEQEITGPSISSPIEKEKEKDDGSKGPEEAGGKQEAAVRSDGQASRKNKGRK